MVAVITKKTKLNDRDLLVMPFVGVAQVRRLRIIFPDAYVVGFVGGLRSVYKRPDSSKAMTHSSSRILRFIISARSSQSFSHVNGCLVRRRYKPQNSTGDAARVVL